MLAGNYKLSAFSIKKEFFSGSYLQYIVSYCQISQVMTDRRKTIFRFTNNNEVWSDFVFKSFYLNTISFPKGFPNDILQTQVTNSTWIVPFILYNAYLMQGEKKQAQTTPNFKMDY